MKVAVPAEIKNNEFRVAITPAGVHELARAGMLRLGPRPRFERISAVHPPGDGLEDRPALDLVATRLTEDQLIRQVLQGGGNMPAYGKNLSPPETTALVQFLETLHPINQPAAADASRQAAMTEPVPKP